MQNDGRSEKTMMMRCCHHSGKCDDSKLPSSFAGETMGNHGKPLALIVKHVQ
jgi:hypothetical protein